MWGGEHVPPESDLEFDIELLQVNKRTARLTMAVMTVFAALGCLGVFLYKLLTGIDLTLGLDDDDEDVVGTVEEMEEEDVEDEYVEEEEEDPEAQRLRLLELERLRAEEELRRKNRGAGTEAHTLFRAPAFDMR